ncbi:unnamed protein product [Ilex paraguariensis]|uniref:Uncharacterized protein n=1 Tax=Ilex paraguariensis TaxID=185542 RepID=A0ABC8UA68_9AQUA
MEVDLLKSLEFEMGNPTIKTFLRYCITLNVLAFSFLVVYGASIATNDDTADTCVDLKDCGYLIHELQLSKRRSSLVAVREKYKQHKAVAAKFSKKAVKYAREDDLILHALEIESTRQCKTHPDFSSRVEKQAWEQDGVKESPTKLRSDEDTDDTVEKLSISEGMSNLVQELSQFGVSFEEPNHIGVSNEQSCQI